MCHIYPVNNLDKSLLCQIVTHNGKISVIVTGSGEVIFEQQEFPCDLEVVLCTHHRDRLTNEAGLL